MPLARKGEKITDPAILERLAKAREKALETRRRNAQAKKDAKLVQQLDKKKADEEVQSKLKKAIGSTQSVVNTETPAPVAEEKPVPEPEQEEEVQIEYIKAPKRKPKPKKKKVVIVESESSEEEEVVYKKKSKRTEPIDIPRPTASPPPTHKEEDPIDVLFNKYYGR